MFQLSTTEPGEVRVFANLNQFIFSGTFNLKNQLNAPSPYTVLLRPSYFPTRAKYSKKTARQDSFISSSHLPATNDLKAEISSTPSSTDPSFSTTLGSELRQQIPVPARGITALGTSPPVTSFRSSLAIQVETSPTEISSHPLSSEPDHFSVGPPPSSTVTVCQQEASSIFIQEEAARTFFKGADSAQQSTTGSSEHIVASASRQTAASQPTASSQQSSSLRPSATSPSSLSQKLSETSAELLLNSSAPFSQPSTSSTTPSLAAPGTSHPLPSTSSDLTGTISQHLPSMSEFSSSTDQPPEPYDPESDIDPVTAATLKQQDDLASAEADIRCFACDTEKIKQCWLQAMRLAKVSKLRHY